MKKGNRVLAMFLAFTMLVTSIAWDFSDATVVEAEETTESTSAITQTDDGVSINFDNIDVAELDANGYTSTKFVDEAAVSGEVNRAVSEHWFSGDGDDTLYGSGEGSTIKAKNVGLKTQDIESNNSRTFMYTPYTYEDFEVSAEIYYGAYSGIVFGEKNVYPTDDTTASSVAVFFNGGRIHVVGAIDNSTLKIMRGTSAAYNNGYSTNGRSTIFNNGSGDAIGAGAGTVRTLNVKKTGNHLFVWISGGSGVMTIELADTYKTGWIGIQGKCYDGDGGGFKSLAIEKVHAVESQSLDNAVMSELDDMGYSASVGSAVKKDSVADAFFSGTTNGTITTQNEGMKSIDDTTNVSALNIPYIYENFRLEAEVYHGQLIGVAVGDATSYPRQSKMLSVFYNIYNSTVMLQLEGAYQSDTLTRVGGSAGGGSNMYQFRPTKSGTTTTITGTKEVVYTIVLEVRDGVMTVWMEGYDGYLTASVADTYATGKISLISRKAVSDGGGIKSYTITNLDAGDAANFDDVNLTNLTAAGYTASDCADTTLSDKAVSDVWFSGESNYPATDTYMNAGLKPNDTDSSIDLLNLPHTYSNFRLETTMYHGQVVGVAIGKDGAKPSASSGTDNGVISIYTNSNYIELRGAVNKASVNLTAGTGVTNNDSLYHYIPTGHTAAWNTEKTLVVEVQDGILTVWMEGYEGVLRMRISDNYAAENIALIARRYNTSGNPGGGLKGYTIEKLPSTTNIGTTVDVGWHTDFDSIDTTELDAKGFTATQYDTANSYAVKGEDQTVSTYMYAGEIGVNASGSVAVSGNVGLKSKSAEADSTMTVLNTPYKYKNFRISTEVYWGVYTGIVLGAKNVFPTSDVDSGVRIYFNSNQIQLGGNGVDYSTQETTGGGIWNDGFAPDYIFKPVDSYASSEGAVYTLNVELLDGVLTVWLDGYDGVLTIKTSDTFKCETIGLMTRQYDGDGGGLKSVSVENLNDAYVNFDNIDVSVLDEQGYTATQFDKNDSYAVIESDQPVSSYWFSGASATRADETTLTSSNTGIKANVTDSEKKAQLLNTPYRYENFTATAEIYWGVNAGFVIGTDNVYPRDITNYPAISVYFANNRIQLGGALDYTTASVTGTGANFSTYATNTGIFYFTSGFTATTNNVYTLNIEMKDGILTVWVDGYEGVLTLRVADHYKSGRVALMHHKYDGDGGGFKSFEINEIETLSKLYTPAEFASYRSTDGYTAPSYHDYLFAGWFYDEECTESVRKNVTEVTRPVYAKFVSSDILTIRAQISGTLEDNLATNDDKGSIRFITTVDSLKYSEVGFVISYDKDGDGVPTAQPPFSSNEVYEKLYAVDYSDGETIKYVPSEEFCASSTYFKACTVRKVGQDYYDMEFTVTPFWITSDGTTVEGETAVKSIDERWVRNAVYIDDSGSDDTGLGTPTRPYSTLNNGIDKVVDGGEVYVTDTCTIAAGDTWKAHSKSVTITGVKADSASVLQVASDWTQTFCIKDAVTFENITFQLLSSTYKAVYAEGNKLTIEENVIVSGVKEIYGGSRDSDVGSTDLNLYAGTYEKIYGGSNYKAVTGNTRVTVGGKVNEGISSGTDWSAHNHVYMLYGGSYNGSVGGNTYVTVESGTEFIYIYGGGHLSGSKVSGSTNVTFAGKAMSIYGGSYYGTNSNTNVVINDGYVQQVFGGCEEVNMEGNVNVQVLGGEVARRLYGGCYNDYGTYSSTTGSLWASNYYVKGHINVVIGEGANLSLATNSDNGIFAVSRYKTTTQDEWGTLVFNDGAYDESKVGSNYFSTQPYHYLVKATSGGTVTSEGGYLKVTPGSGYSATVMNETSNTEITVNEDGTYTLPEVDKDSKVVITVTFSEIN